MALQHEHRVRSRRLHSRVAKVALVLSAGLLVANACSSSDVTTVEDSRSHTEAGRLRLSLTATTPDQVTYQLRNALFVLAGRETGFRTTVSSEAAPSNPSLLIELPPDTYDVLLEDGFVLTVLEGDAAARLSNAAPAKVPRGVSRGASRPVRRPLVAAGDAGAPTLGRQVPAELVSPNPATTEVFEDAVTGLDFLFRVGDDVVGTSSGFLDLGIGVVGDAGAPPASCSDEFEPNDSLATASRVSAGPVGRATLCGADEDFFVFDPPVAAGEPFEVRVSFQHAMGDLDAYLLNADGEAVAFGESVTDDELLAAESDGRSYTLQASLFLASGPTLEYSFQILPGSNDPEPVNGCCESSTSPGCSDPVILGCVCNVDPFCCEGSFDDACVELADECGASCAIPEPPPEPEPPQVPPPPAEPPFPSPPPPVEPPPPDAGAPDAGGPPSPDCCTTSSGPGCGLPGVEACVCAADSFCCEVAFDDACVELAAGSCGAQCQ